MPSYRGLTGFLPNFIPGRITNGSHCGTIGSLLAEKARQSKSPQLFRALELPCFQVDRALHCARTAVS
jgi:hypothetical protein